eukprot:841015-Heterocapsa_arctica.AAC.1
MPQEEQPPEASPKLDPWEEQPADKGTANKPLEAQGHCYGGTGYWAKGRGQWMGLQPPAAID